MTVAEWPGPSDRGRAPADRDVLCCARCPSHFCAVWTDEIPRVFSRRGGSGARPHREQRRGGTKIRLSSCTPWTGSHPDP